MGLTITNANTINLLNIVNRTSASQSNTLTQLSTGLRINKGADDPAGLIALESLNAELTALDAALSNNQRSDSMLSVADSAIAEISTLLTEIESLVVASANSAGITEGEIAANQSQIDSAISAIDRIVSTSSFNGKKLLDGSQAIRSSGIDATEVSNLRIFSRNQSSTNTAINVSVTASAQTASATLGLIGTNATASGASTITVTGALGTTTVNIASGSTQAQIVAAINESTSLTGVSAVATTTSIDLDSTGYGTDEFVSVSVLSGGHINHSGNDVTFATTDDIQATGRAEGVDATVLVNGQSAGVDGLDVSFSSNGLSLTFSLTETFGAGKQISTTSSFTVLAQGGATFQLGTDSASRSTIGIDTLSSYNLGGGDSGGFLRSLQSGQSADLNTNTETALRIVKKAITDIANVRGRIGGFQKFQVQTQLNSLTAAKAGISNARSVIAETDFAVATAKLNRESVLLNSGISLLGLANQQASQILSLLG